MKEHATCIGKRWRSISLVLLLLASFVGYTNVYAQSPGNSNATQKSQSVKVTGVVVDSHGDPLPSVNIRINGTKKGTVADLDGKFILTNVPEKGTLTFSFVGFETKELSYKDGQHLRVVLSEIAEMLDEVSVVAYGTRNTREVVGAISSVKGETLEQRPSPSIENLLQGQMSGVGVTNRSGAPGGGGSEVVIRGYNSLSSEFTSRSPLYVIDGVPVQATTSESTGGINPLSALDPSTIESVEVLKDAASASLYGSRAANGVILVTTKKGRSGQANFSVSVSQSLSYLPETPVQTVGKDVRRYRTYMARMQRLANVDWMTDKLIFPNDYRDSYGWSTRPGAGGAYDYFWNNGGVTLYENDLIPGYMQDSLNTFYNNQTNWWKYMFQVGKVTSANITATGGTDNVKYMVSAGYYDEKGIMINSNYKRANFSGNLDINLTSKLSFFARTNLSYIDKLQGDGGTTGAVQGLTVDPSSTPSFFPGKGSIAEKVALRKLKDTKVANNSYNVRLNLGFNYKPIKGLSISTTSAVDHYLTRSNIFTPDYLDPEYHFSKTKFDGMGMTLIQNENVANYTFNLQKNNFDLMVGSSYTMEIGEGYHGGAQKGPSNLIHYIENDAWPDLIPDPNDPSIIKPGKSFTSDLRRQKMFSYFGRVAYNYDKKYLVEATVRRDGSSAFGKHVRWGTFPSVALGWAFSEEAFMKDAWWLSYGKVRASWGRSGQKLSDPYMSQGLMASAGTFLGTPGISINMQSNPDLTWELSDQYDFGLDMDFLNYALKVRLDYYYKRSYNLVMETTLPGNVYSAKKAFHNGSEITNEGIELELAADIIRNKPVTWSMNFNISRNWNLFSKSYTGIDIKQLVLGRPLNGIYTFQDEGIVQDESQIPYYYNQLGVKKPLMLGGDSAPLRVGGRKIKDQNNDGVINSADLYYAGTTIPAAYGGFSNQVRWKGFTLDVLMTYTLGRRMLNMVQGGAFGFDDSFGPMMNDLRKHSVWQQRNDNALYPHPTFGDKGYNGQFDGNIDSRIENVSYLRLQQVNLSYNLPKVWVEKLKMKSLKLYVNCENLGLLTNYSGLDPEIVDTFSGKDTGSSYPLSRRFTLGLQLNI